MIRIEQSADVELLSDLSKDVQNLHHNMYPDIFKSYDEEATIKFFSEGVFSKDFFHYVIYSDDVPCGYVAFEVFEFPDMPFRHSYKSSYIHMMSITKGYRRKGLGKKLIEKVIEVSKGFGIFRIELDYWCANANAKEFYESLGFLGYNSKMYLLI